MLIRKDQINDLKKEKALVCIGNIYIITLK